MPLLFLAVIHLINTLIELIKYSNYIIYIYCKTWILITFYLVWSINNCISYFYLLTIKFDYKFYKEILFILTIKKK